MKIKTIAAALGLGACLTLAAGSAYSSSTNTIWSFQDDDIDFVLTPDSAGNITIGNSTFSLKTSGPLEDNDVLLSIFEFPTVTKAPWPDGTDTSSILGPDEEMTGIAAVEVEKIPTGGFNFTSFTEGLDAVLEFVGHTATGVAGMGAGEGGVVAMWVNSSATDGDSDSITDPDYNLILDVSSRPDTNCANLDACIHQATLGTLFQVDGFTGDPDESWTYFGTGDLDTVKNAGNTSIVGGFNYFLGTFFNHGIEVGLQDATGEPSAACGKLGDDDGCVNVVGSGTLLGGKGLTNGAVAHSDTDAKKYVPEPASLALLGLGLLGFGFRKRMAS